MPGSLVVSASGIRGVVGEGLTPGVAARYGAAFAAWLGGAGPLDGRYVVLGRDARVTGGMLADAAAAGLRAAGADVRDAGIAPTPTLLLAAGDDDAAAGALVVTASHNPIEWNGLKLGGPDGRFLSPEAGRAVGRLYEEGPGHRGWDGIGSREPLAGAVDHHLERILSLALVDREAIAARGLVVALDCVRGAGGTILPLLLRRLGCEVVGMDLEPDGRFPRDPEPLARNLARLGELVRETGADLGLAVDPDADRLALVDGGGRAIGEDWTLTLAVEHALAARRGPVVTNLSSSQSIEDAAERAGVPCLRTPVGEVHVATRMAEVGAPIGGEGNGGVILADLHLTRDAPVAAALVLSLLARRGARLEELLAGWPRYHLERRRYPRPDRTEAILSALRDAAPPGAETDVTDGLRLAWRERREWVHARASGTEPILRVLAEATTRERAAALAEWAGAIVGAAAG